MTGLTDADIRELKTTGHDYIKLDDGFHGLGIRVSKVGVKSWTYRYWVHGKRERLSLGGYPEVSITQAHRKYKEELRKVLSGEDPKLGIRRDAVTFGGVIERFLESDEFKAMADSAQAEMRRIAEKDLAPTWGHRHFDIEAFEIQHWGKGIRDTRGGYIANRTHQNMQQIWKWGLGQGQLRLPRHNPFLGIAQPFTGEKQRERVLTNEEIATIFQAITREPRLTAAWWAMTFLTAMHDKREVMGLEWREYDRAKKVLVIPAAKTKSKRILVMPLSEWGIEVLELVEKISGSSRFVFPSGDADANGPMTCTGRAVIRLRARSGVHDWQIRDIRRTVAAHMTDQAGLDIDSTVIDRLLNHAIPNEPAVSGTYQTLIRLAWKHFAKKQDAINRWSEHLDTVILEGKGREMIRQALSTPRPGYEGPAHLAPKPAKPIESWGERKARLAAEGRDIAKERKVCRTRPVE